MFTKYREQLEESNKLKKVSGNEVKWLSSIAAYGVATMAIVTLSLIFAQTVNNVFVDSTMKIVGAFSAIVVGASSFVFLVFKNDLLKSHEQYVTACVFVIVEFSMLTLGAAYVFKDTFGWYFAPVVIDITHVAIVATFPVVALEWIVVLALDPDAKEKRSDNHTKSKLSQVERQTRETFLHSDPVVDIRRTASLAEVLADEMNRLPPEQRGLFVSLLRQRHGSEYNGIPLLLGDDVDSHRSDNGIPISEAISGYEPEKENGRHPKR